MITGENWVKDQGLLTVSPGCGPGVMTALPWTLSTLALAFSYNFFFSSSADIHARWFFGGGVG